MEIFHNTHDPALKTVALDISYPFAQRLFGTVSQKSARCVIDQYGAGRICGKRCRKISSGQHLNAQGFYKFEISKFCIDQYFLTWFGFGLEHILITEGSFSMLFLNRTLVLPI